MKILPTICILCPILLSSAKLVASDTRGALDANGVSPFLEYTGEALGNLSGGQRQGVVYDGAALAGVRFDLEKLARWQGATLLASALYPHGSSLTQNYTRDLNTVSNIDAYDSIRLYELWLEQTFADNIVSLRAGQLLADTEFFVSEYSSLFINSAFGALPLASLNLPAPVYPIATPGIRLRLKPCNRFALLAAVFDGNAGREALDREHGVGWHLNSREGVIAMMEMAWLVNQDANSEGLRGTYKFGSVYHSADFDAPGFGSRREGNFFAYAVADQELWRGSRANGESLGGFLRMGSAPSERNLVAFYLDGGFNYKGLLPGRDDDLTGLGVSYTKLSNDARDDAGNPFDSHHEVILELTYLSVINRWISVQPDLQYIFKPGATSGTPDAIVAGIRFNMSFE